jgi:hypothetical protein
MNKIKSIALKEYEKHNCKVSDEAMKILKRSIFYEDEEFITIYAVEPFDGTQMSLSIPNPKIKLYQDFIETCQKRVEEEGWKNE